MEQSLNTLAAADLAAILKRPRAAILRRLRENPDSLPPPLRRIGREPLWLAQEVHDWLLADRHSTSEEVPEVHATRRSRGRPRQQASTHFVQRSL